MITTGTGRGKRKQTAGRSGVFFFLFFLFCRLRQRFVLSFEFVTSVVAFGPGAARMAVPLALYLGTIMQSDILQKNNKKQGPGRRGHEQGAV